MKPGRRRWIKHLGLGIAGILAAKFKLFASARSVSPEAQLIHGQHFNIKKEISMKLGAFSISLNVKDINISKQFYENLGFTVFAGALEKNYLIMKNEDTLIGLFQGMFKDNILTFNPGWDQNAGRVEPFEDVRSIQKALKGKGIKLESEADESTAGPASFVLRDPDGNMILFDQHI